MALYRKRPDAIQAMQFTGATALRDADLVHLVDGAGVLFIDDYEDTHLEIPTLMGVVRADIGDWIIKDLNGRVYPCKPDIFAATYEAV